MSDVKTSSNSKIIVCFTGFSKSDIEALSQIVGGLGCVYESSLTTRTTHLVCATTNSSKYACAQRAGIICVTREWLDVSEAEGHPVPEVTPFFVPPLYGCIICPTGLTKAERAVAEHDVVSLGGSFSGDKDEPIDVDGHKIYYRGHRILVEIIKDLLANKGLDKATHVLLVGDSAGGMASYFHADEIGSMLPKNTIFKVAPFSGIFLDLPNVEGQIFWRDLMKSAFERQNCSKSVNDKCVKAQAAGEEYKCFLGQYAMEYIETPLFVINSRSDLIGILCIVFGAPLIGTTSEGAGNCTAIPGSLECFSTLQCTHEQFEDMEWYASNFSHIIENKTILHKNGNGLYEYSCYSHADEPASYWSNLVVQNVTLRDAVSKWFFSTNESASMHTYKDCITHDSFYCNPTCIPPVPPTPPSNSSSTSSSTSSPSTSSSHSSPSTSSVTPTSSSTTPTPSSTTPTPSTSSSSGMVLYPMVTLISAALVMFSNW